MKRSLTLAAIAASIVAILAIPAASACPARLTIERGDTMSGLASACGVNVGALLRANPGIHPNRLQPGATIEVPRLAPARQAAPAYGRPSVQVAPPIAGAPPQRTLPTNLKAREFRQERPIYVDPAQPPRLPGMPPLPGQPGSPGFPLR